MRVRSFKSKVHVGWTRCSMVYLLTEYPCEKRLSLVFVWPVYWLCTSNYLVLVLSCFCWVFYISFLIGFIYLLLCLAVASIVLPLLSMLLLWSDLSYVSFPSPCLICICLHDFLYSPLFSLHSQLLSLLPISQRYGSFLYMGIYQLGRVFQQFHWTKLSDWEPVRQRPEGKVAVCFFPSKSNP